MKLTFSNSSKTYIPYILAPYCIPYSRKFNQGNTYSYFERKSLLGLAYFSPRKYFIS